MSTSNSNSNNLVTTVMTSAFVAANSWKVVLAALYFSAGISQFNVFLLSGIQPLLQSAILFTISFAIVGVAFIGNQAVEHWCQLGENMIANKIHQLDTRYAHKPNTCCAQANPQVQTFDVQHFSSSPYVDRNKFELITTSE